jgi:FGGY family of carbohydrate kinases, N-terminal domain
METKHRESMLQCHCVVGHENEVQLSFAQVDTMMSGSIGEAGSKHIRACRDLCREMSEKWGRECFRKTTGLPISTYFSAFKVAWLYANVAAVRDAMDTGDAMIGTVDSWIIYNLTGGRNGGVHVTDGAVSF